MKLKKRYLAAPLAIAILASPLNLTKYRLAKADYIENIIGNFHSFITNTPTEIKEVSTTHKLTKPITIPEVSIYVKKPRFKDIDKEKRKVYFSKRDLNHNVDSLYKEMWIPKEIPKNLFKKMIRKESSYNIYAHHPSSNARGLGQILEETWEGIEKEIPYEPGVYNPTKNLEVSLKVLKRIYNTNKKLNPHWKNLDLNEKRAYMLASYNWGIGNLENKANWDLNKTPEETKDYINYILNN
jgi:soluble lytic murein transglycosylase-like protein